MNENDFRFEISRVPEPDDAAHQFFVRVIERIVAPADDRWPVETIIDGEELEAFYTDDPYREVAGAREAQEYSLEERLGPYGIEWEREQEERMHW